MREKADSFVTIYALSQTLGIGEQKLKAGFQQLYQQTIWDYANQIRMTKAASLLKNTDKTVDERNLWFGLSDYRGSYIRYTIDCA